MWALRTALAFAACCALAAAASTGAAAAPAAAAKGQLQNAELSPGVRIAWSVDEASSVIDVQFAFDVDAKQPPGYVAIGLSQTGGMKGADIWLLRRNATTGQWALGDYHAVGFVRPQLDASQDLRLVSSRQAPNGTISAHLRRALAPCDENDLPIQPGVPLYVIWAYGAAGDQIQYHGAEHRGSKLLVLAPPAAAAAAAGPAPAAAKPAAAGGGRRLLQGGGGVHGAAPGVDAAKAARASAEAVKVGDRVVNLTLPRLVVSTNETTYMIKYFQLPHDKKRWITRYAPLFNSPLVHHAVVYSCTGAQQLADVQALAKAGDLGPHSLADKLNLCHSFFMLTSPGSNPWQAPKGSGLPIGGPGGLQWVALEIHYNNPEGLTNVTDPGSGLWFEVTDGPLKQDVGLLALVQSDLSIPPGRAAFSAPTAVCPASCTAKFKRPVTLIDQGYHMHGIGKSAITRRFAGGRELPPLHQLGAYDYGFQSFTPVPQGMNTLSPGERLEFTCTFDSRSRKNTTRGGPGTNDEMCFHWIYYYPAQADMGICSSAGGNGTLAACGPDVATPYILLATQRGMAKAATRAKALEKAGEVVPIGERNLSVSAAPYVAKCSSVVPAA